MVKIPPLGFAESAPFDKGVNTNRPPGLASLCWLETQFPTRMFDHNKNVNLMIVISTS